MEQHGKSPEVRFGAVSTVGWAFLLLLPYGLFPWRIADTCVSFPPRRLGNYPLLRLLVCRGADPQQKSSQNRVPMDFAWEREDLDTEGQQIMDFLSLGG